MNTTWWYLIPAAMMLALWGALHCTTGGIFHHARGDARDRAQLKADIADAITRAQADELAIISAVTDETGRAL